MFILISSAFALDLDLSAGPELVANDPFQPTGGLRLGAVVRPLPWLGAGVSVAGEPLSFTTASAALLEANDVSPDYSRMRATASVFGDVRFARGPVGSFTGALDLVVGVGGVYTVDDCAAIDSAGDSRCLATERELHPAPVIGLAASVEKGRWGLRLRGERWQYTERVLDQYDERKIPVWLGVDVVLRLGPS